VVSKGNTGGFWSLSEKGVLSMNKAAEIGGTEVVLYNPLPGGDALTQQVEMVEAALENNPLALVVAARDMDVLAPLTDKAYDMGIPVVTYDSDVNSDKYDYFFASDNVGIGVQVGKQVAEQLGGSGLFAVFSGTAGADTELKRENGFREGLLAGGLTEVSGGTQYNNYDDNRAFSQASDMLTANPDIDAFVSAFMVLALNISVAIKDKDIYNPGDIINVTFDQNDDTLKLTEEGWITGFIQQDPYHMVRWAIEAAYKLAVGQEERTAKKYVPTDWIFVTPDNVNDDDVQKFMFPA